MALKEQDIVFTTTDSDGNTVIQMPITRASNVEDSILTVNGLSPGKDGNVLITSVNSATKATQDGNGATISSTYAKLSGAAFTGAVSTTSTLTVSGACKAGTFQATSDYRLKENFESIDGALEKVYQFGGLIYSFKADQEHIRHAGVIAQDVKKVFPEAVRIDEQGFYCVDYNGVLALLLEAIKEIDQKVKELKNG